MAGIDWDDLKARLGRELWPREREFIEEGGQAWAADFDFANPQRPAASGAERGDPL